MKMSVKIYQRTKTVEKIIEGESALSMIDDTIAEIGGRKNSFTVYWEQIGKGSFKYLIFRGKKKAGVLRNLN